MCRLGLAILAFIIPLSQIALATDFTVPMNATREISHYGELNEDCTSTGETVIRIVAQPQHGVASIKSGHDYPNYPQSNPRNGCNRQKILTTQVWYKPEVNYVGRDRVIIDAIFPLGSTRQVTITIDVR